MLFRHVYSVAFLAVLLGVFPFRGRADESRTGESVLPAGELEEQIREAQSQMGQIDSQMTALEDEETGLMAQAREAHREQYEVRKQILDTDEELQGMVEQIEAMQRDLHAQQEALAQRMAEHTNYAAFNTRQTAVIGRLNATRSEIMQLANDRVRVQLELRALEKQWAGVAEDAAPEPEGEGTTLSAEDPDQL